jgi:hypothetical protein
MKFLLRSFRNEVLADESFAPVLMWKLCLSIWEGDSMPQEILESMRALREDMRQRLLLVPEYRALVALDRSIDEICEILQEPMAQQAMRAEYAHSVAPSAPQMASQAPVHAPAAVAMPQPAEAAPQRSAGIATAFAETLAAKIDQRNLARAAYAPPVHRALGA